MGTDLTVAPRTTPAAPIEWEQELNGVRMLIKSGLLPQAIKTPEAALFIVLTGRDLGLSPVQSLRSIHVIQGKIEVPADMQFGLFHRSGGRSHWTTLTNEAAGLTLSAPWLMEPHTETFTIEDAKRAKLGGDNWQKYPKAMLRSRCITAALKSIGFDPTDGVYAPGEIGGPEALEPITDAEVVEAPKTEATTADLFIEPTPLEELEALIPTLATAQQTYINEKLRDGGDPAELLVFLRQRAVKVKAQEIVGAFDGAAKP